MAERLFRGQIQPQARPLGAFVQPSRNNVPGAPDQPRLPGVSQIATLQQAGTSSVAGFNQMQQLADALKPLGKNLQRTVDRGLRQYAIGNIESGYYDELKNETVRAKLRMQENAEDGAADAATTITQLEKVDPIAASLAREANPWKLIGRRRAAAQLAAGQVSSRFTAYLAENAGSLGDMQPGSPELMATKAEITQGVLKDYGLSGDELESTYYVSPQINKSWDQFTQKQGELYTAQVYDTQVALSGQQVNSGIYTAAREGIVLPTGERVMPGDPRFAPVLGMQITQNIDKNLSLLGGEDRRNAWEAMKQNLAYLYDSGIPGVKQAIQNVRLGNPSMEWEKRPLWIQSNPMELVEMRNSAIEIRSESYESTQGVYKQDLDRLWLEKVIKPGYAFDSPEYRQAVEEVEADANRMGYRDGAGYVSGRMTEDRQVVEGSRLGAPTFEQKAEFEEGIRSLTPEEFESAGDLSKLYGLARQMAAGEPTEALRQKAYDRYTNLIREKQEQFEGLPTNSSMKSSVTQAVKTDLAQEGIASLKGTMAWQSQTGTWAPVNGTPETASEQRYRQFAETARRLHRAEYFRQLQAWRSKPENAGLAVSPADEAVILEESAAAVRKSDDYKKAVNVAKGLKPDGGEQDPPPAPVNQDASQGPVPRAAASSITAQQAGRYKDFSVMKPKWIHSELKSLKDEAGLSKELQGLAEQVNVPAERYLIEQLKFYPQLDPTGAWRQYLEYQLKQKKSGSTAAIPYGSESSTPRSPGSWMTAMVMPVQTIS